MPKKKIAKPMGVCSFCLGDEDKNADGDPEDMIHCAECGNSGHPSCLRYSTKLVKKIQTIRWQCLDCKRCLVCRKGDDSLLFCDLCDAAIHPKCSTPPLHHVPKGEFICQNCREEKRRKEKVSRRVAQLNDGMSKFFSPKTKSNQQRQRSVQKAIKLSRRIGEQKKIQLSSRISTKRKQNDDDDDEETKITKRKVHLDLSKYKNPPSFLHDSLPESLTSNDVYQFLDAKTNSLKLISDCSDKYFVSKEELETNNDPNNVRWPPYIVFGGELIKTWYSSSYPQEYARVDRLFICEFCLKYMKCEQVYDRHRKKCQTFHPPANEIYHKDDLSVFEVDGNINRIYCQNLCLLAKLFLDHKTLYYDVEPFLFYVLTRNDSSGCHFLGYFSKEKHCPQKYNLSCIMVLPHCQRRGYGRFLIELSYILSLKENQIGTPERPLSTHGAQTYEAFWKLKIVQHLLQYFQQNKTKCLLKTLMNETGIAADDIFDTLQNLGILTMKTNGNLVVQPDVQTLDAIIQREKVQHAHWVSFDEEFLRFTPVLKPFLFVNPDDQYDQTTKEIEIIFKEIENDSTNLKEEPRETSNESVQYVVRRRKLGRKRRSIYVKYRVPTKNPPTNLNDDDEHSQEYVSRRRTISVNELTKDDEDDENTSSSISITQLTSNSKDETNHIPEIDHQSTKILSNAPHLSASESDLQKLTNGNQFESHSTTMNSDDQPKKIFNSPLPFKKRAWVSTNLDALIDLPKTDPHLANGNTSPIRMIDDLPNNRSTYSTRSSVARQQQQQQTTIPADHIQSILDNFGQILPSISDSSTSSDRRR